MVLIIETIYFIKLKEIMRITLLLVGFLLLSFINKTKFTDSIDEFHKLFVSNNQIRYDGIFKQIYNKKSNNNLKSEVDLFVSHGQYIFYNNGFCIPTPYSLPIDSIKLDSYIRNIYPKYSTLSGVYYIMNNVINAIIYEEVYLRGEKPSATYKIFNGKIINRDTIVDWHVVRPYPSTSRYLQLNPLDTISRTLVFTAFPAKFSIDSNNLIIKKFIKLKK